ncbi:MAG: polyprenyl diphosphate synthase [Planctomycetia bacterium]|nr:polyprenyl diphosphate synthase [Planctomycetia bacterium]
MSQANPPQAREDNHKELVIPRHIAIVMDGNGRWAQQRGLDRSQGHLQGAKVVEDIVNAAGEFGVKRLTLYCFSNENWKRPQPELDALMTLLRVYMIEQRDSLMRNNIRLRVVGRRDRIPQDALDAIDETTRACNSNTGLTLALAINYGARQEIVDATRRIVDELLDPDKRKIALERAQVQSINELINEDYFGQKLYDADAPDPDLFIRTGGEQRLSNYLLWQLSYSELWFTNALWPDFTRDDLWRAILDFQSRRRRYGGLDSKTTPQL